MNEKTVAATKSIMSKIQSESALAAKITEIGQAEGKGAVRQANFCESMFHLLMNQGAVINGGLADNIISTHHYNVERYGQRAYVMSEKQIASIARELWPWFTVMERAL